MHKEYAQLTKSEQAMAKAEYARALLDVLGVTAQDGDTAIEDVVAFASFKDIVSMF